MSYTEEDMRQILAQLAAMSDEDRRAALEVISSEPGLSGIQSELPPRGIPLGDTGFSMADQLTPAEYANLGMGQDFEQFYGNMKDAPPEYMQEVGDAYQYGMTHGGPGIDIGNLPPVGDEVRATHLPSSDGIDQPSITGWSPDSDSGRKRDRKKPRGS